MTPALQARWLQQAAYLAWRNPRVKALVQYGWRDDAILDRGLGRRAYAGWQSGLVDERDRLKPALAAFARPFWVDTERLVDGRPRFWGQVRPGVGTDVDIERRPVGSGSWTSVKTLRTDARGYFTTSSLAVPAASVAEYRFSYTPRVTTRGARPAPVHSGALVVRMPARRSGPASGPGEPAPRRGEACSSIAGRSAASPPSAASFSAFSSAARRSGVIWEVSSFSASQAAPSAAACSSRTTVLLRRVVAVDLLEEHVDELVGRAPSAAARPWRRSGPRSWRR